MINEDDIEYALKVAIDLLEEYYPDYDNNGRITEILDIYYANFD